MHQQINTVNAKYLTQNSSFAHYYTIFPQTHMLEILL